MFRLIRIAMVAGAAAGTLFAGPAGAITCPPGTTPTEVCVGEVCEFVCVPNAPAAAIDR